ncbi:uncharacterized protein HaLaN_09763, partial [Haematococcus lacustris]
VLVNHTPLVQWTCLEVGASLQLVVGSIPVKVTALPADHCPGACMLLFTSPVFGAVLATGDVRFSPELLDQVCQVLAEQGVTRLDLLHLDATFGLEPQEFPSLQLSLQQLSRLLDSNPNAYPVNICVEALGSESILRHLHSRHQAHLYLTPQQPAEATAIGGVLAEQHVTP